MKPILNKIAVLAKEMVKAVTERNGAQERREIVDRAEGKVI